MPSTSSGRVRAAVAAITIGAVGALVGPAITATAATTSTTIHGDVHLGSKALAGYRVGFFDRADGSVITGRTASDGTFSLQVPSDVQGYAFAGSDPSGSAAISAYKGRNFVRGVIGLHQPSDVAGAIYQSLTAGLPAELADGGTIHLRLQHSGRVTGTGNLPKGSEITIERLDGARVGAAIANAHGTFRTKALVPGKYLLEFRGGSYLLSRSKVVQVVADKTVTIRVPHLVKGGVVEGTVKSGGKPITHPVTVVLKLHGQVVRQQTTSSKGTYRFVRLMRADYIATFGDNPPGFTDDGGPAGQPSSSHYLHSVRRANVPADLGTVVLNASVKPAGMITATAPTTTSSVVVERSDDRGVVRSVGVLDAKTFTIGGLPSGHYVVFAMTKQGELAQRSVVLTAGRTVQLGQLVTAGPAPAVSGTVSGSKRGSITLQPEVPGYVGPQTGATIASDGTFTVPHAFPGTYTATAGGRAQTVTIAESATTLHLQGDDADGTLGVVLTSHGNQLQNVSGSATSTSGHVVGFGSRYATEFTTDAPSGTYAFRNRIRGFDLDQRAAPASDGPWWYNTPAGGFTISPGATTHVVEALTIGP